MKIDINRDENQCMAKCTIYKGLAPSSRNHMLCIYGFENLSYTLSYVKGKVKMYSYMTLVIKDTTYVLASKGIQPAYLNLDLQ